MKADAVAGAKEALLVHRVRLAHEKSAGVPLVAWAVAAVLNLAAQMVLRRDLDPGEFGTMNTALGAIGLMALPLTALQLALVHFPELPRSQKSSRAEAIRASADLVTETFTWLWAGVCVVLIFPFFLLIHLPRFSLQLFSLIGVLMALGGLFSWSLCWNSRRLRLWAGLIVAAAVVRLLVSAGVAGQEPWAESGIGAVLLAGFVTLVPAMRSRDAGWAERWTACAHAWDRDFLLHAGATCSVLIGLYLFSSGDRIVAQSWFGSPANNNLGVIDWAGFDAYQSAGLLARALLWGTQPLLWVLFAARLRITRTRTPSLTFLWAYLVALAAGVVLLFLFAGPASSLLCGSTAAPFHQPLTAAQLTGQLVPSFALAMVPLGFLQALGLFSLASRRHPECFVFGGCGIIYTVVLFLFGRQPTLMISYMFGSAVIALMVVLLVGVVRWGRKQP